MHDLAAKPVIYDDEDEEALIADFVKMSAVYDGRYTHFEICNEIFAGLRDPERGMQVAAYWNRQLGIQERIRQYKLNGPPVELPTKEQRIAQLQAIFENEKLGLKERLSAAELIAKMMGEIVNKVDKNTTKATQGGIHVTYARYDDDD